MLKFYRNKWRFLSQVGEEALEDIPNPGRGWYRMYTLCAGEGFVKEEWYGDLAGKERLALLLIDLGAYRERPLDEVALAQIEEGLALFEEWGKELLLRFVYDRSGEGMLREPSSLKLIQTHMGQLAELLFRYEQRIYGLQGLFVGSWGEMHSSRFLTPRSMAELWSSMRQAAPESCFLAVRRPSQWRELAGFSDRWEERELEEKARSLRLGLFNDGLLGSDTDLGTWQEDSARQELDFQDRLCRYVPNGGETVGGGKPSGMEQVAERFSRLHLTYLNGLYDPRILEQWKQTRYQGENGYHYIGKRLGYRFVVREAGLMKKVGFRLRIVVENTGFGCFYQEGELALLLRDQEGNARRLELETDPRRFWPGERREILTELAEGWLDQEKEPYFLSLAMTRRKDQAVVRFANEGAGDELFLGRLEQ